jgi:hypothetical protein
MYHDGGLFSLDHFLDVGDNLPGIVVGNFGHPASSNTISTIDEHHRNDGAVPHRLNFLVVLLLLDQQRSVVRVEQMLERKKKLAVSCIFLNFHSIQKPD